MGLPVNIEDLLHGRAVEKDRLEFKQGWNPEEVLRTLCAFANDFYNLDGGYVIVGVAEQDGQPALPPVGIDARSLDRIQRELLGLENRMQPLYHPVAEVCEVQGRHVLFIRAPGGQNRPYRAPASLAKGCHEYEYFIRRHSSTVRARGEDLNELMSLAAKVPFDDRLNQRAAISDVKLPLIEEHLRHVGSTLADSAAAMEFTELGRRMNIVGGPPEACFPLNVGLMFFNSHPEAFFPQTQIDVVEFPQGPGGDVLVEKTFVGPLGRQLVDALSFIKNNLLKTITVKQPMRAEADRGWNYPYEAIEEVLANAVYHRSYEIREPIEVRIEPEALTVTSYPGPDRSISMSDLKKGRLIARRYRNRRIGEFLKELRLTEGRGTGIPKVIRAMKANDSPPPRFETNADRSYFTAILPLHPAFQGGSLEGELPPRNTPLDSRDRDILEFCRVPRRRAEVQGLVGLKDAKHFRDRYLAPLLASGWLRMTQFNNPSSRGQRYQTTEDGLKLLKQRAGDAL